MKTNARRPRPRSLVAASLLAGLVLLVPAAATVTAATAAPLAAATKAKTTRVSAGKTAKVAFTYRVPRGAAAAFLISGVPSGATARIRRVTTTRFELQVAVPANAVSSTSTVSVALKAKPRTAVFRTVLQVLGSAPAPVTPPATTPPVTAPPATTPPVTTPPAAGSFALRTDNPVQTAVARQTVTFGVSVDRAGYPGPVSFSVSGVPAGATSNFAPNPTTAGTVLYVTPSAATPDGDYRLTITGTGTVGTPAPATASVVLTVRNVPDFALTVPASFTVAAGTTAYLDLPLTQLSSAQATVSLDISGMPAGMTTAFTPNPTFGQTTLTIATVAGILPGSYPLTITGTAGAVVHRYTLTVVIPGPPDFALGVPATASVAIGSTALVPIGFTSLTSAVPTVTMTVAGLPTGVTAAFTPNPTFGATTMTVTAASNAAAGTYPLVITGTAGTVVHQYGLLLTVAQVATSQGSVTVVPSSTNTAGTPGYGLAANPATLTIARGSAGILSVDVSPTGGFGSPVVVSLSGLPAGVTTAGSASGNTATFVVSVPAGATPGASTVTVTGTSGNLSASVTITLVVA